MIAYNHETSLRNASVVQLVYTRTALFYNSFLPATVRDWNYLPLEFDSLKVERVRVLVNHLCILLMCNGLLLKFPVEPAHPYIEARLTYSLRKFH